MVRKGTVFGVTALTHGNEPAGLAAIQYILDNKHLLKSGKIILGINNIKAAEKYFYDAQTYEDMERCRMLEVNMNRLPKDALEQTGDSPYEIQRLQEIHPITKTFDVGLDVHSTEEPSPPMIMEAYGNSSELSKGFPIEIVIRNIVNVQCGLPVCAFYGEGENRIAFGIESGQMRDEAGFRCTIECTKVLLSNIGMMDIETSTEIHPVRKIYEVVEGIIYPNDSYRIAKHRKTFEFIPKGDLLAKGDQGDILMKGDGHFLFGFQQDTVFLNEEALILTKPMYEEAVS